MKFIGREQEQKTIQRLMSKEGYQGCVIYGRRRMGKTELVRKCVLEKAPSLCINARNPTSRIT